MSEEIAKLEQKLQQKIDKTIPKTASVIKPKIVDLALVNRLAKQAGESFVDQEDAPTH